VAVEDHVLDAGKLEEFEAEGGFLGARPGTDLQGDAVAVAFVVFLVAAGKGRLL
jgi:hypothetical protein